MPVTSVELIGRRLNSNSIQRVYHFHGPATESEVLSHIPTLPQTVAGMPLAQVESEEVGDISGDWVTTLFYGSAAPGQALTPQSSGTVEYEFNFQAPGGRLKRSLQTVSSHPRPGQTAPPFNNLMGMVQGEQGLINEGIDFSPPAETFALRYAASTGVVTTAYQDLVENMVGKVNSSNFAAGRFAAGELFLTRVSGRVTTRVSTTQSQNSWNIEFGFAYSPNATNLAIGAITIPTKLGWHLVWTWDTPEEDAGGRFTVLQPHTAYVERVFDTADFKLLGLPGYTS